MTTRERGPGEALDDRGAVHCMNKHEVETLLDQHAPQWRAQARIDALAGDHITVTLLSHIGRASAGVMALADRAAYYLTLARVGRPDAVTVDLDVHFVGQVSGELVASAKLLGVDDHQAITAVDVRAGETLVAHAIVTCAYRLTS
jgi:acyl-coenzyme A thioesterase PaaI-like protein